MTFREVMIKAMTSRGMFESQAEEIMEIYINSNSNKPMIDKWDENENTYPENMRDILWMGVKDFTARWLEENLPQAWFRPMFQYSYSELEHMMNNK